MESGLYYVFWPLVLIDISRWIT